AGRNGQGAVTTESSAQRRNPTAGTLESAVRWRDEAAGLVSSSRIVIAADATTVTAVRGECLLASDLAKDVAAACEAALATLDPGVPSDKRVALAILDPTTQAVSPPAAPRNDDPSAAPKDDPSSARIDDPSSARIDD